MTTNAVENNKAWFMVKICLGLILLSLIFPAFQQKANATSNGQQITFDASSYEVNKDAGYISIPITREGGKEGVVSVTYCTCNGSAVAPDDFTHSSGTMIFYNEDETTKSIRIPIQGHNDSRYPIYFFVKLITPTGGAQIGDIAKLKVIITNKKDGTPPTTAPTPLTDSDTTSLSAAITNPTPEVSASPSPTETPTSTPTDSPAPTSTPAPKVSAEEPQVLPTGKVMNMPNTATPWYNYIVVGSLLVLLSGTMLYRRIAAFRRE